MKQIQRFHQGDVQGRTVKGIPKGAMPIAKTPLAYGEHSGHQHVLTGDYQLFEFEGTTYAAIGHDGASLQHVHESAMTARAWDTTTLMPIADHKPIQLQPNQVVEFWIQNAYNPYLKLMERVVD